MADFKAGYEVLERKCIAFAEGEADIRTMVLLGSRARADHPADEWSDLDFLVFCTDPARYVEKDDWLIKIGEPIMSFLQDNPVPGGREHRVLFAGGFDVDFVFIPVDYYAEIANHPQASVLFFRGVRFVVDKDGIEGRYPLDKTPSREERPGQWEFLNLVKEFWYHTLWTAKKTRRGELFTAKSCLDSHLKRLILIFTRWHRLAASDGKADTWHETRYFEEWADPRVVAGLRNAYARYDEADIWRALFATMELFDWLAVETAARLGYLYPKEAVESTTKLVREIAPPQP